MCGGRSGEVVRASFPANLVTSDARARDIPRPEGSHFAHNRAFETERGEARNGKDEEASNRRGEEA
jgi:hypothetical protein